MQHPLLAWLARSMKLGCSSNINARVEYEKVNILAAALRIINHVYYVTVTKDTKMKTLVHKN
jgi:hypothetical protein